MFSFYSTLSLSPIILCSGGGVLSQPPPLREAEARSSVELIDGLILAVWSVECVKGAGSHPNPKYIFRVDWSEINGELLMRFIVRQ